MIRAYISSNLLPVDEQEDARALAENLTTLAKLAKDFEACFALVVLVHLNKQNAADKLPDNEILNAWEMIALRNGAMTAYGFQEVLQALNVHLRSATTLRSLTDIGLKRSGSKRFEEAFPQTTLARFAAAHPGEHGATKAKVQKNSVNGPIKTPMFHIGAGVTNVFISDAVLRKSDSITYSSTVNGKYVSYEISEQKCLEFYRATNEIWNAFAAVMSPFEIPFPQAVTAQQ